MKSFCAVFLFGVMACGSESRSPTDSAINVQTGTMDPSDAPMDVGPDGEPQRIIEQEACEPSTRRLPSQGESGTECVCQSDGIWECFGVTEERQIGGDAVCNATHKFSRGPGICDWTISDCSDNRTYMLLCSDAACGCIVNAVQVGFVEARCAASAREASDACGWSLTVGR